MNVMLPSSRKALWPLVAGAALAALLLGLWLASQEAPRSPGSSEEIAAPPVEIPEAVIEQVGWKVKAFPAGVSAKLTKAQKASMHRHKVSTGEAVTTTIDALMFEPDAIGALTGRSATAGAARALARSKLVPAGIKDVKVIRRAAQVGIDVSGMKRAAARFAVGFKGWLKGEDVRLTLTGAFWLERYSEGWKIVAFEGESKPYRTADKQKGNRNSKGDAKKKSKGKKS